MKHKKKSKQEASREGHSVLRRHGDKLLQYLEENDKPRFKSYARKHKVDVRDVRLDGGDTLLHSACRLGHDIFVRYLLKKRCNPLLLNAQGDLPLHLAVVYTLSGRNTHAYTDLLHPLVIKDPHSLDIPNARGDTCRELLKDYKCSVTISDSESSESLSDDHDDRGWNERLADELMADQHHPWENYSEGVPGPSSGCPENYDQWADRMREEYHQEYTLAQCYRRAQCQKRKPAKTDQRPKISEEKRRAFQENMAWEREKSKQEKKDKANRAYRERIAEYEGLCDCLFGDALQVASPEAATSKPDTKMTKKDKLHDSVQELGYDDLPWPFAPSVSGNHGNYPKTVQQDAVIHFLFEGLSQTSEEYVRYVKTQQRRWHPDRFLQKCGSRLLEKDREEISSAVTQISQVLNKLSEVTKQTQNV